MKVSQAVDNKSKELWAVLATAAAARALFYVQELGDCNKAEMFADTAIGWLEKAGAKQSLWVYRTPRAK